GEADMVASLPYVFNSLTIQALSDIRCLQAMSLQDLLQLDKTQQLHHNSILVALSIKVLTFTVD
ncbi:hypothetical protein, partial [Bacteroides heparinolyticus]|uniref:hypothetical protein n=1 Tax=Prevotella heparinolytica TaxID=28113 RepID=UPI00359FD491